MCRRVNRWDSDQKCAIHNLDKKPPFKGIRNKLIVADYIETEGIKILNIHRYDVEVGKKTNRVGTVALNCQSTVTSSFAKAIV